jgi:hypothetical protein
MLQFTRCHSKYDAFDRVRKEMFMKDYSTPSVYRVGAASDLIQTIPGCSGDGVTNEHSVCEVPSRLEED